LTPAIDLHRRIAAVVGLEVVRQLRERRVAQEDFEIVIRTRVVFAPRKVAPPLPLRYRAGGNGVGRQNQVLVPYPGLASTTAERI
jgi:hypothetical protein